MMSALAMILTAAMMVQADGHEKVSGEVEQGLDLSKKWEGTLRSKKAEVCRVRIDRKVTLVESEEGRVSFSTSNIIDEGGGKLIFRGKRGLYRQADDLLVICVGDVNRRPPVIGEAHGYLLILHRAKSRK
jgi:hypothetical protein